ncbi:hypothetical protein LCGC14_2470600, partial [marine sediment metagenome]
ASDSATGLVTQQSVKTYVDNTIGFSFNYFLNDTADAIGGIYYKMEDNDLGGGESTLSTIIGTTGNDKPLVNFITPANEPGVLQIEAGVYNMHVHAEKTAGSSTVDGIYWELYKREVSTVETLLGTSEISSAVTVKAPFNMHLVLSSAVTLAATDRLLIKFYANLSGGAGATVALYQEGTTDSYFSFQVTSNILSNVFLRQDDNLASLNNAGTSRTNLGLGAGDNPIFGNLTITSFAADWTNAGRTVADMGILTTVDINGGTIDGVTITGGTSTELTALSIRSTGALFDQLFATATVFTADRTLNFDIGDADRTLTISANIALDQNLLTTSDPTFGNLNIASFGSDWNNAGRTVADMGILTTVDINGGTIDGTAIGGAATSSGVFSTLKADNDFTAQAKIIFNSTTVTAGAGAVAITGAIHEITTTGIGDALTLVDGLEGQRLNVVYVAEGGGGETAILTPTNLAGADATITFNNLGDTVTLLFTAGAWYGVGVKDAVFA